MYTLMNVLVHVYTLYVCNDIKCSHYLLSDIGEATPD